MWACTLPENAAPPATDAGAGSPASGASTGGSSTGGSATGGTTTGGSVTGGTTTGGTTTGGTGGATGGSMAGSTTGGTVGEAGKGGMGGSPPGAGMGGQGGTGGGASGMGGTVGGAGSAGKGGSAGTGGSPPTGCPCLAHRYSFSGADTTATDSVGSRHGTIVGGSQSGGAVTLGAEQYVELPAGIVSALSNATFEAWVTWTGGTANWQRVFDFGSNDGAAGEQGTGASYIFFTPRAQAGTAANCTGPANFPRVAATPAGPPQESCVMGASAFPTGLTHIAVSIGSTLTLYINGAPIGTPITPAVGLSFITDTHNWLGRSQFSADMEFAGTISEFRIYNTERSSAQIAASNTAGPDTPPTQ
jgi:hypothetical protein